MKMCFPSVPRPAPPPLPPVSDVGRAAQDEQLINRESERRRRQHAMSQSDTRGAGAMQQGRAPAPGNKTRLGE